MAETIAHESCCEVTINRSRFIAIAFRADSEEVFQDRLKSVRDEYPAATHYVWAYVIRYSGQQLRIRFSDDGEPGGTAGRPVLTPIQGKGLTNVAIIVVRYYGGIKLGAGGLSRAYGSIAAEALTAAGCQVITRTVTETHTIPYARFEETERRLLARGARVVHRDFAQEVTLTVETDVEEDFRE